MFEGKERSCYENETRELALTILNECSKSGKVLDKIVEKNSKKLYALSTRDRALLNYIVYGVIRWYIKLDWIIGFLSKKPINSMSYIIVNIMRIGLFQVFFSDRIPDSAAVNTSVELAKKIKLSKKILGYINGTLRNAIRNSDLVNASLSRLNKKRINHLSVIKSFPEWMISRWIKQFGYNATCNLCDNLNTIPEIFIRVNSLKVNKSKLKIMINKEVRSVKDFHSLPCTLSISGMIKPIEEMRTFIDGMFSVQDAAAQMASYFLSPTPGELILDACSGLGGKSTHMAQLMNNQGKIVAVDNIKSKLKKLTYDASRLGINIIEAKHLNLEIEPDPKEYPLFDRIMLDAPCSGLGVIRRNPDAKWSSSLKKILKSSKKQLVLLKNVSLLVKPQGLILYVVCSTEREENENVINKFLEKSKNFKLKQKTLPNLRCCRNFIKKDGFLRTYPNTHGMDGFFMALLKRKY